MEKRHASPLRRYLCHPAAAGGTSRYPGNARVARKREAVWPCAGWQALWGRTNNTMQQPSVDFINGVCRCLSALGLRCPVFSAIQPSPARCTNGRAAVGTHILIAASPPVTWLSCTSPRNVTVERDSEIGYRCIARISTGWYLALPAATPPRYICPSTLQKKTR